MRRNLTLIFLAHLDDESLSTGGLIQNRLAAGGEVVVSILFGRKYSYGAGEQHSAEQLRHAEAAMTALGVKEWHHYNMEEGEPHKVGYYQILKGLEEQLAHYNPTEVIIPSEKDLNQDHRFLNECCKIALRPANLGVVRRVLAAHGHDGGVPAGANYFVELTTQQLETKLSALACYTREARQLPHPRSPEILRSQARVVGSMIGAEYAEPYTLVFQKE